LTSCYVYCSVYESPQLSPPPTSGTELYDQLQHLPAVNNVQVINPDTATTGPDTAASNIAPAAVAKEDDAEFEDYLVPTTEPTGVHNRVNTYYNVICWPESAEQTLATHQH